jgi:putative hemolysin
MSPGPFGLREWFDASPGRRLLTPFESLVERVLGLETLRGLYTRLPRDNRPFPDAALDLLSIDYEVEGAGLAGFPRSGPLIVVANHPFGGADGLVLLSLLARVRPDVRLLANDLLDRIPELRSCCFFVDTFGTPARRQANARALRAAIRHVGAGGALAVFPAGEVSSLARDGEHVADRAWSPAVARIIRSTRATVVPLFFSGTNSSWFHMAGRVHPRFRTALLPRELLAQRGRTVACIVGPRIEAARLDRFEEPARAIEYLRLRTQALAGLRHGGFMPPTAGAAGRRAALAHAEPSDAIEREINGLESCRVLVRNGGLTVHVARAQEAPATLREIGRLREIAFRAAGEGSGQARDVDAFDSHYHHLFVWNGERREIVGAYRLGATDEILPRLGVDGLYTSTLFQYDERLLAQIHPALELGRAFVRTEYQRDYSPLLLLWKGIATFVARQPRYRMLFGPVSISNDYHSLSRQILARFLYATSYRRDLGELVTPRNPPPFLRPRPVTHPVAGPIVKSLAEVGTLLSEIESDRKGVPVLVRQYLKLNARLLGFNVDPQFGQALDGLMLVDLTAVDRALLTRYMGAPAADAFLAHHGAEVRRRAS